MQSKASQTDDQSADKGKEVANFVNSLDVYTGTYQPDYIVFDKYERDGFGSEAIANYAYNATNWTRYLSYVKTISDGVESPAMIWQIPGGHMPTQDEGNTLINVEHEAPGGSYFMGDARIGTDINNVRTGLLDKQLNPTTYNGASNVRELLEKDAGLRLVSCGYPRSTKKQRVWLTTIVTAQFGTVTAAISHQSIIIHQRLTVSELSGKQRRKRNHHS
ncbi:MULTISPECIES: hypothetical protein [unclassified Vibrio]|uniref:hypothetical protein n=1 Tax=Vibrio TaxID=662 RepID=UPI002553ACC5|nr:MULTISPECIES: hypothetical protein [unclassified Vibrio]